MQREKILNLRHYFLVKVAFLRDVAYMQSMSLHFCRKVSLSFVTIIKSNDTIFFLLKAPNDKGPSCYPILHHPHSAQWLLHRRRPTPGQRCKLHVIVFTQTHAVKYYLVLSPGITMKGLIQIGLFQSEASTHDSGTITLMKLAQKVLSQCVPCIR